MLNGEVEQAGVHEPGGDDAVPLAVVDRGPNSARRLVRSPRSPGPVVTDEVRAKTATFMATSALVTSGPAVAFQRGPRTATGGRAALMHCQHCEPTAA